MTAPSINPRRFSKGRANLDPNSTISVFISLKIHGTPAALNDAFRAVNRQQEDWPQAKVAPVALNFENGHYLLIFEVRMGPACEALRSEEETSPQVSSGYGFIHAVSRNLYNFSPVLTSPPTEVEREAFRELTANPRSRQRQEVK